MLDTRNLEDSKLWLCGCVDNLPDFVELLKPSRWVTDSRYLPRSTSPIPGPFSWSVAPYIKEILDCLDPSSSIREIDVMKGVQICATVSILENVIGYSMGHIKSAPTMMVTADDGLSKLRMDTYITPMIQHSNLEHLIKSADDKNKRKTGKTDKKIEWEGGGFLIPFGAQNANKLRSISIQILLCDEIDGWPDFVGKDGDPLVLVSDRTAAYEETRKILTLSTPLFTQTSKIRKRFDMGDKRKYMVPCRFCSEPQELVFSGVRDDGVVYGLDYVVEKGRLKEDSVVYLCKFCQKKMHNEDKAWMYRNEGEYSFWQPTAEPLSIDRRSYHIPAIYSPPGMQSWTSLVKKWISCWDVEQDRVKDVGLLQVFYNNVLGLDFEKRGEALKYETVVTHRRAGYTAGTIPNILAGKEGGRILFLTCAVDVHKNHLDIQIIGWCNSSRFYSVNWFKLEGECTSIDLGPWRELEKILESEYVADDGARYRIQITLIDSGYSQDTVYSFCSQYTNGVFPIAGRQAPVKTAALKEFSEFTSRLGTRSFNITTTIYKDRLAAALRKDWEGMGNQPAGYPNFPADYSEQFFKELTAESKKEQLNKVTGQRTGFVWHCPSGVANHAWDLTVYNWAALDMMAWDTCTQILELEQVDWIEFWKICEEQQLYLTFEK